MNDITRSMHARTAALIAARSPKTAPIPEPVKEGAFAHLSIAEIMEQLNSNKPNQD